jgi:hypothetical protein
MGPGQGLEEPGVTPIAAGERQGFEEPGDTLVENGATVAASLVAERAGDPALADTGGADDGEVVVTVDPVAGDEPGHEGAVDAARRAQIDILHAGVLAQGGELEPGGGAPGVTVGGLAVGHDADALLEGEGEQVGRAALLLEGPCHAGQAEGDQTFVGGVGEHDISLGQWK